MLTTSETALICDLAQTYGVRDYRSLPLSTLAALAAGLGEDARVRQQLSGSKASMSTMLLAVIADRLAAIDWHLIGGGEDTKPSSILDIILGTKEPAPLMAFNSMEEFQRAREEIIRKAGE